MSAPDVLNAVGVVASALGCGGVIADGAVWHPVKRGLSPAASVDLHRIASHRADLYRPIAEVAGVLAGVIAVIAGDGLSDTRQALLLAGSAATLLIVAVSVSFNMPINRRIAKWQAQSPPDDRQAVFGRWQTGHLVRMALSGAAILAYAIAAVT